MSYDPSLPPSNPPQHEPPYVQAPSYSTPGMYAQPQPTNTMGLVGFILSLSGIACGLMFLVGMIVSLIGLRREPKGFAIAGTIIGGIGTLFITVVVMIYAAVIISIISLMIWQVPRMESLTTLGEAATVLQDEYDANGEPSQQTADGLIIGENDSWGNQIVYEPDGQGNFVLRSAGPDSQYNTSDDIELSETYGQRRPSSLPAQSGGAMPVRPLDEECCGELQEEPAGEFGRVLVD